jgi:hypothetical protein
MRALESALLDLSPPDFAEGLDDWSSGDGTPGSPTYEDAPHARIAVGDAEFGTCLEMRKIEAVQRLRYMAELPIPSSRFVEIRTRVKVVRGALPGVRVAAWPGGLQGRQVPGLLSEGPLTVPAGLGAVHDLRAVVGPRAGAGVDLVWDGRVLYAHVGLDLVGPIGSVVRIERLAVEDVTSRFPN